MIRKGPWDLLSGIADDSALQPWRVIGGGGGAAEFDGFLGTSDGSMLAWFCSIIRVKECTFIKLAFLPIVSAAHDSAGNRLSNSAKLEERWSDSGLVAGFAGIHDLLRMRTGHDSGPEADYM